LHSFGLDCGYFDHAHFIREFKKMIGESPKQFLNGNHSFVKEYMGRKILIKSNEGRY
jgi:AraC-like DNA-binding protein|tara:strand:+ start:447 stop:617 length:171 start_codon:yes stop_codon:yes gene_type:complete